MTKKKASISVIRIRFVFARQNAFHMESKHNIQTQSIQFKGEKKLGRSDNKYTPQ